MSNNLIIVESPTKIKTIKKYLGEGYNIVASKGHVRDLPQSTMGIDIEKDFEPKYIIISGKTDTLVELKKLATDADMVYLATDPDREGEAISWHLAQILKLDPKKQARITFNEITKSAITASLQKPRDIDMNLVDAQQARRVLDRLVGYSISPILWSKVKRNLSAGRVQSVAVRMICDRDAEIDAFVPEEYWELDASISVKGEKKPIVARFYGTPKKKIDIHCKEEYEKILGELEGKKASVYEVKTSKKEKKPPFAFVTSSLQQEANKALNFSTSKTMRVAQQLYENGMITYLRTDSVRISDDALKMAQGYIASTYGKEYVSFSKSGGDKKSNVQDAHEAIRPTDINVTPESQEAVLDKDEFKLYQLIWKRFVASRMTAQKLEITQASFLCGSYLFKASASKVFFDGYTRVYTLSDDEDEAKSALIGNLQLDSEITDVKYEGSQHFTQPPAHYTEASLVKAMEEEGIGRPSTYSATIDTIQARRYVKKDKKSLLITELGKAVNEVMVAGFPSIVDIKFTANIEEQLDKVATGEKQWKELMHEFYPQLKESVDKAQTSLKKVTLKEEETDVVCDKCGRHMVVKQGPHGKFLACPGFPDCKNTMPYVEKIGVKCPNCGKDIIVKHTRTGRVFYGCEGYPQCDYSSWTKPKATKSSKKSE